MMMFTAKMCQLTAVVLGSEADKVTKELLKEGVLHFVKVKELEDKRSNFLSEVCPKVSETKIAETRKRIESFFRLIDHDPVDVKELDVTKLESVDIEECNSKLDAVAAELQKIRDKQKEFQIEIHKYEDIERQFALFEGLGDPIRHKDDYVFLSFHMGVIPAMKSGELEKELRIVPSVKVLVKKTEQEETLLVVNMKRDDASVRNILERFEWADIGFPEPMDEMGKEASAEIEEKLALLRKRQEEMSERAKKEVYDHKGELEQLWANLRMNELFYKIQSFYIKTYKTTIFSGWVPAVKKRTLDSAIKSVTGGRCYLEWSEPRELKKEALKSGKKLNIPVKMENPGFLSPFEMLVKNYSVPEYGTVDPTPFVAVAYLMMFGLMFADVGHGAVIALIGIIGAFFTRKKKSNIGRLMQLMIWCGCSAMITGALFGSYFGYKLMPPLWFDYHGIVAGHGGGTASSVTDIYGILLITIYFGIGVICMGLLLNWVNCVSKKEWIRLIFDKSGILGGIMYMAGIYCAFYFARHDYREMPSMDIIMIFLFVPALLMMAKAPLEHIFMQKKKGDKIKIGIAGFMNFGMSWLVEMLEVFSGYLSNTLSFMRVAGLGIAHVSLMMAFDQIARMVTPEGPFGFGAIMILVFGNILVIGLEGLSAGIQSLRLNYYEFFSRYFCGNGNVYSPISLKEKINF